MNFDNQSCLPAIESWSEEIKKNIDLPSPLTELKLKIRSKLLATAKEYTEYLSKKSREVFNKEIYNCSETADSEYLILSGHQPEIYHHGLLFKNYLLNKVVKSRLASGINLIIDTDEGTAGTLVYPFRYKGQPQHKKTEFNSEIKPFMFQRIPEKETLIKAFREINNSEYLKYYEKLAGEPVTEAHTIIRRIFESDSSYFEVPISKLLHISEIKEFLNSIIIDYKNFSLVYNQTLKAYRAEHNIKNHANPFPDLNISESKIEMPFWLIDKVSEKRFSLFAGVESDELRIYTEDKSYNLVQIAEKYLVVPKAALITLLARLILSDFFIHGTGGGKYDRFTDNFIYNYYKIKAPLFAVATADKYYFKEEISEYETLKNNVEERRKIGFHVDKYLHIFEEDKALESRLSELSKQKIENIEKIKLGKSARQSTAEFTREIKKIESEMKSLIETFLGPAPEFKEPSKTYLETIYARDFAFFAVL